MTESTKNRGDAKLNNKQELFCQHYANGANATQAMVKAGHSRRVAGSSGSRMLKDVKIQNRVQQLRNEGVSRLELSRERVLLELKRIGFANLEQYTEIDENGKRQLKPSDQWSDDAWAAIQEITVGPTGEAKIKLHSKTESLKLLSQHVGLLEGKQEKPPGRTFLKRISEMDPAEKKVRIEKLIEHHKRMQDDGEEG